MTNKVHGYRTLSDTEVALINEGKELAEQVGAYLDRVQTTPGNDTRWLKIGATDLQKGFMAVVRSIARPTTF